jgi:signal transduction histidine kinase
MNRRRQFSVRARLLTGLVTLTALFLLTMGTVSAVVLGRVEHEQFNDELQLTARSGLTELSSAPPGYTTGYISYSGSHVDLLTSNPATGIELLRYLKGLVASGDWKPTLQGDTGQVFGINVPGGRVPMRAATRILIVRRSKHKAALPPGMYQVVVAVPAANANSHLRELLAAEIATGALLLGAVLIGGRWLIGRGLAPLDKMASTADLITSQGDLAARMPDPGDNGEAGRLAAAINKMLDQIHHAFDARLRSEEKVRQFAADASHELRTPLTTIRGYAELYRQGALGPAELPNAMRRIEQESERMSSLVAELLELARLDKDSSLNLTDTDLAEIVRDATADARAVEPDRPVTEQAPAHFVVQADEPRIRQVLANLLGNVRAHTPRGTPVTVRLTSAFAGALLEVADAGPGMSPVDASRAFDRFHRGANGTSSGSGSGLGLSIVQAIATAHGGHAQLHSEPGTGTVVQIWIPRMTNSPRR